MAKQNYARGCKLTTQHVYDPATSLAADLSGVALNQAETTARTHFQWTLPQLNSRMYESGENKLYLPFIIPEFQENFDLATKQVVSTSRILDSISISWDQRAEPYAIADYYSPQVGAITAADMERCTIYIKLYEKVPTIIGGTTYERTEMWNLTIPGVEAYGSAYFRANPLVVDTLRVALHPYRTYFWEVSVPGLYSNVNDRLAMPSFTIHCTVSSPLLRRDKNDSFPTPAVQNMPTIHAGIRSPDSVAVTTPAADALIDGTSDIQATHKVLEEVFQDRLRSGYGTSQGLESDIFPTEHLENDAALSVIIVPMWQGFEDLRGSEVPTAGLPYTSGPNYLAPTAERRLLIVPEGFVLHHAFAVCSTNAPPSPGTSGNATWGALPTSIEFYNRVGIALNSGIGGDDYKYQQVAYTEWTPVTAPTLQVDKFLLDINSTTIPSAWAIYPIPLVSDNVGVDTSFVKTGQPFFMGSANTTTAPRSPAGNMPTLFGGAAFSTPATNGGETAVEIRWQMEDATFGLNFDADSTLIGTGGHWVVLVGKATVSD